MTSKRQLAANRENAQKSTGPVTAAGKEAVSQNAFKHGLCGKFQVLPCEDQSEYDDLFNGFMETEKPVDEVERELVAKMARHTWLSDRALRCQEACFLVQPQTPEEEANRQDGVAVRTDLEMYLRYQSHHDRAYQRASNELTKRRNERRKAEIGFVLQKRAEAQEERREAREERQVETHQYKVACLGEKLEQQFTRTRTLKSASAPASPAPKFAEAEPAAA